MAVRSPNKLWCEATVRIRSGHPLEESWRLSPGAAKEIWHSSAAPRGAYPYMAGDTGGGVINWAAGNQLVIASEEDGWRHLYVLSADGGKPKLVTPGDCEVEQWSFTPDK